MNFKVVFDYTRFPDEKNCKNVQSFFRQEKLENIQSTFRTGIPDTKNVKKAKSFETRRFFNGRPYGAGLHGL